MRLLVLVMSLGAGLSVWGQAPGTPGPPAAPVVMDFAELVRQQPASGPRSPQEKVLIPFLPEQGNLPVPAGAKPAAKQPVPPSANAGLPAALVASHPPHRVLRRWAIQASPSRRIRREQRDRAT